MGWLAFVKGIILFSAFPLYFFLLWLKCLYKERTHDWWRCAYISFNLKLIFPLFSTSTAILKTACQILTVSIWQMWPQSLYMKPQCQPTSICVHYFWAKLLSFIDCKCIYTGDSVTMTKQNQPYQPCNYRVGLTSLRLSVLNKYTEIPHCRLL